MRSTAAWMARARLLVALGATVAARLWKRWPRTEGATRQVAAEAETQATAQLKQRVRGLLDDVPTRLADGAAMPPSTARLEAAYAAGDRGDMYVLFVEFFMEMKLEYDMGEDDMCRPTAHACTDPNDSVTKRKLPELYATATSMMKDAEPEIKLRIWRLVVDKLFARVGLDNDAFDEWARKELKGN